MALNTNFGQTKPPGGSGPAFTSPILVVGDIWTNKKNQDAVFIRVIDAAKLTVTYQCLGPPFLASECTIAFFHSEFIKLQVNNPLPPTPTTFIPPIGSMWEFARYPGKRFEVATHHLDDTAELMTKTGLFLHLSFNYIKLHGAEYNCTKPAIGSKWEQKATNLVGTILKMDKTDSGNESIVRVGFEQGTHPELGFYLPDFHKQFTLVNSPVVDKSNECQHREFTDLVMFNHSVYACKQCGKTKDEI